MPSFVITKEGEAGREVTVAGALIGIGRDARNEICLTDPDHYVSRFHAVLVRMEDGVRYFIRDLSSVSGLFVNGASAYQRILSDGDTIQIAAYQLAYANEPAGASRRSRLRVVPMRAASDVGAATAMMPSVYSKTQPATDADRQEMIQEFHRRTIHIADVRKRLELLMPALIRVMSADRGFAGFFLNNSPEFDELGATGMQEQDEIEIEDPNALAAVFAGGNVHEHTTLLAPVCSGRQTIAFVCIDRRRPASPFTSDDLAFLSNATQLVASSAGPSDAASAADDFLAWPSVFVGKSRQITPLVDAARNAATAASNILILGESGSGKELIAKMVHDHSRNHDGPFVARNCAAIPESLAEAELFGYAARSGIANADPMGSAGWFEMAHRGTLFLDEVHALSAALQDKLLRVLEDRQVWRIGARAPVKVDLIVIAATDKDLNDAISEGTFRRALYHRFTNRLEIPSLRERKDDIRLLAHYFVDKFAAERGTRTRMISQRALDEIMNYEWPGNVRELQNSIASCVANAGEILFSWDLPLELRTTVRTPAHTSQPVIVSMEDVEREKISEALRATRGNITRAAQLLGYKSRQTILNKMDAYGIPRDYGDLSLAR